MKKLALMLGILGGIGALVAAKKRQDALSEADLWHEATAVSGDAR